MKGCEYKSEIPIPFTMLGFESLFNTIKKDEQREDVQYQILTQGKFDSFKEIFKDWTAEDFKKNGFPYIRPSKVRILTAVLYKRKQYLLEKFPYTSILSCCSMGKLPMLQKQKIWLRIRTMEVGRRRKAPDPAPFPDRDRQDPPQKRRPDQRHRRPVLQTDGCQIKRLQRRNQGPRRNGRETLCRVTRVGPVSDFNFFLTPPGKWMKATGRPIRRSSYGDPYAHGYKKSSMRGSMAKTPTSDS